VLAGIREGGDAYLHQRYLSLCLAKTLMTKGPAPNWGGNRATLSMEYTDLSVFKQMY
jgi:hypothetical protein